MEKQFKALKAAFPHTIPVMTGYLFLGVAFGILLTSKGYHFIWAIIMSLLIYAGSMQFVAVEILTSIFNPLNAFLITLRVNARHLFYGLSMLTKFRGTGSISHISYSDLQTKLIRSYVHVRYLMMWTRTSLCFTQLFLIKRIGSLHRPLVHFWGLCSRLILKVLILL